MPNSQLRATTPTQLLASTKNAKQQVHRIWNDPREVRRSIEEAFRGDELPAKRRLCAGSPEATDRPAHGRRHQGDGTAR